MLPGFLKVSNLLSEQVKSASVILTAGICKPSVARFGVPITLSFSQKIGDIMKHIPEDGQVQPTYKFYM